MRLIDLSQTIRHDMNVYPGDPVVRVKEIHTLEKEGWRLKQLELGSHTGTHVDAPAHMVADGKTIDELPLDRFYGKAVVVESAAATFKCAIGLIFREGTIDISLLERIERSGAPFVVTGNEAHLTIEMERAFSPSRIS